MYNAGQMRVFSPLLFSDVVSVTGLALVVLDPVVIGNSCCGEYQFSVTYSHLRFSYNRTVVVMVSPRIAVCSYISVEGVAFKFIGHDNVAVASDEE